MGSLLKRTVANVTVHINNMVCKYLLPGGVISLSCKSVLIHSVGQDLAPGAMVRLHHTAPSPQYPSFFQGSSFCCVAVLLKHPIVAGVITGSGGTVKVVRGRKEKEVGIGRKEGAFTANPKAPVCFIEKTECESLLATTCRMRWMSESCVISRDQRLSGLTDVRCLG